MMQAALLAEYLANLQPLHVRNRLLLDQVGTRFSIMSRMVIGIGGSMHVDQPKLFAAVRQALRDQQTVSLIDADGYEIFVKVDQGRIFLEHPLRGRQTQLDEFMIFSPNPEERTQALRRWIDLLGPTAPDFSAFLTKAAECELSDEEIGELFAERADGVTAYQSRAAAAFNTRQTTLGNLVPDLLTYFERFCGPNPDDVDHEEYYRTVLSQYRKDLLRRDLVRGLDICLQGALRDDLVPGPWTKNFNDDELWDALTVCDPWRDPFALLGALDIALDRQHDSRYQAFAEEAVKKLIEEEFPRPDGVDTYELLPLWAELVLNRINGLEGGALRSPCWKRMCAWMQAGFLSRLTLDVCIELESFREWIRGNQTQAGIYATILDLRHEPMYQAAVMSRGVLREGVIGRLLLVRDRHQNAGRFVPGSNDIDEIVAVLTSQGRLGYVMPGPLDGHFRPAEKGIVLQENNIEKFKQDLNNNPDGSILTHLTYLSQCFDLGEELLAQICDVITRNTFFHEEPALDGRIGRLTDAGLIACAQRDKALANAIGSSVIQVAHRIQSGFDTIKILRVLLISSTAFEHEDTWAEWLERQLAELALRMPAGESSQMFLDHLCKLKRVLKLDLGIHCRAEALALAAN